MTGKTPKRPRDSNQLAKRVVDIATGEESEESVNLARSKAGKKGAKSRTKALTPEQRADIARIAANARWSKKED
ncbi:MAG: hypothetical protein EP347_04185 [Alphaproteobacteria bacterium]|nr:MAG: hypothetical protein EP347_04185 [Alphaproteobacteria bacterium]